jgi:hypothetical protein
MQIQPDGTILIQAALDGGFYRVSDLVESSYPLYLNRDADSDRGGPILLAGHPNVAQRQKAIHAAIADLRRAKPQTFSAAWNHLQSTQPTLFQGLEDTVVHAD